MTARTSIRAAVSRSLIVASWIAPAHRARASAADARSQPAAADDPCHRQRRRIAVGRARRQQIGRHRSAARHQGRAGRRSQDRQRRRALVAPRLHHRHRGRPDQRVFLRRRRQADRRLRHRGDARSQRHPRGDPAGPAGFRYHGRGHRRRRRARRHRVEPGRGAAGLRYRGAAARRRQRRHRRRAARSSMPSSSAAAIRSCSRSPSPKSSAT